MDTDSYNTIQSSYLKKTTT